MVEREISISKLAKKIKRSREAVSKAINHGQFPIVVGKVKQELGI